jgi:hypothetical protein
METTLKQQTLETIKKLPEDCSLDDIMETLWVQKKIFIGREEIKQGKGILHEDAKKRLEKWLQ